MSHKPAPPTRPATGDTTMHTLETPVFPADLMRLMGIGHANTLRRYIKEGKVPPPDKRISQKTRYWHRSTLEKAGVIEAATTPHASR